METITFAELGLSAKVLEAITTSGYTTPTPIQAEAIPVALTGRDVLGIAQTGTGKTASFTLPMISRLETGRARARMPRSLILAPTRELAAQVAQSFEKYGVNHKLDVALLIGGVSMDDQTRKLERGVDVLIATPGRLIDHFQRGRILLMGVEILVIDEADRMLDMGFIPDIEKICKLLPPARQTLFFSATMPPEITRLVHTFMRDPKRIEVAPPATTAKTITQRFVFTKSGEDWDKREQLRGLLRETNVRNAIIFCNRKVDVAIVHKSLVKHGFNAGALHGDMEQRHRTETLDKFRSGDIAFLVASDVAARGLDIPDVSHVFNYDLPRDKDDYVHRIGRTGRAGKEGCATSIVMSADLKQLLEIQKMLKTDVVWTGEAPTEEDYADAGKRRRGKGAPPARSSRPEGRNQRGPERHAGQHKQPSRHLAAASTLPHVAAEGHPATFVAAATGEHGIEVTLETSGSLDTAAQSRANGPHGGRSPRPNRPPMDRDPALNGQSDRPEGQSSRSSRHSSRRNRGPRDGSRNNGPRHGAIPRDTNRNDDSPRTPMVEGRETPISAAASPIANPAARQPHEKPHEQPHLSDAVRSQTQPIPGERLPSQRRPDDRPRSERAPEPARSPGPARSTGHGDVNADRRPRSSDRPVSVQSASVQSVSAQPSIAARPATPSRAPVRDAGRQAPGVTRAEPSPRHRQPQSLAGDGRPTGFDDNVPAFLKRTSRPAKTGSDT